MRVLRRYNSTSFCKLWHPLAASTSNLPGSETIVLSLSFYASTLYGFITLSDKQSISTLESESVADHAFEVWLYFILAHVTYFNIVCLYYGISYMPTYTKNNSLPWEINTKNMTATHLFRRHVIKDLFLRRHLVRN